MRAILFERGTNVLKIETISEWEWIDVFKEKVNKWLTDNSQYEIVDVKYSTVFDEKNSCILYSAIILYKV